jgi:hypothetical protein
MPYDRSVLAATLLMALCACSAPPPTAATPPSASTPPVGAPPVSTPPVVAPVTPPVADDGSEATRCDPAPAQWAIGKAANAEVVARIRADSHAQVVRVIHPGEMVTMDFSDQRVDIRVDAGNRVIRVSCG